MTTTTNCSICTEPFNKKNRRSVICKSCNFECCTVCLEDYYKIGKATPQCMNCHKPWNNQYLKETFGATTLKRILDNKKELLFNEQKALFPHTQQYVNLHIEKEKNNQLIIEKTNEINRLKAERNVLYNTNYRLERQVTNLERNCLNPQSQSQSQSEASSSKVLTYIQACSKENCKGFIDEHGICGLCKTVYCKKCLVEKTDGHECNEETVLSIEAIKKDSKSCPNCSAMIHRISGCPDMFCTSCYTSFNWNTLKIDARGNSNPLYYRWLREGAGLGPGFGGGNVCDGRTFEIHHVFRSDCYKNLSKSHQKYVSDILASLHHTTRNYRAFFKGSYRLNTNFETQTIKLRRDFMINKSTEKNFKTQLLKIQKQREFNTNIQQIRDLVEGFRFDTIRSIVLSNEENPFDFNNFVTSYTTFSEYINNCVNYLTQLLYGYEYDRNNYKYNFIIIPKMNSLQT